MIINLGMFVRRENIREVQILNEDLCRSLLSNQAGYLSAPGRVDFQCDKRGGTEGCNVNYVDLMFRVECGSCNSFFSSSLTSLVVERASLVV